jgi:hypothetical protein
MTGETATNTPTAAPLRAVSALVIDLGLLVSVQPQLPRTRFLQGGASQFLEQIVVVL